MDSFVSNQAPIIGAQTQVAQQTATAPAMATAQHTPALGNITTDAKAQRFIERAEAQTSKIISSIGDMKKLSNKKYYSYTTAQVNEMMSAIQSAMDEVKKEFLTDTTKFHGLAYVCALLSCEINEKDNDTKERIFVSYGYRKR